MQFQQPDNIHIELAPNEQAVALALGNASVILLDDRLTTSNDLDLSPVQRAVWAARLRTMADLIESGTSHE